MATEHHVRSRGLVTDLARAVGWIALGKGLSQLPRRGREHEHEHEHERKPPIMRGRGRRRRLALSKLEIVLASIVGVVLALLPRQSDSRKATS